MPKRKSAPAPPAAAPSPAVGDLVWVLGLGGEALEKPWPAIIRDVDTDGNSVAWPPAQVDGVRSYECDYLDHALARPRARTTGSSPFEGGYARVAKSSEWEIKAKNWDAAHESALALLAEKVDSSGPLAIAMGPERSRRTKYEKLLGLDKASAPSKKRKAPAAKPAKKKPSSPAAAERRRGRGPGAAAEEARQGRAQGAAKGAAQGAAEAPRRRQARQGCPRGAHGRRRLDQGGEAATRHDARRQVFCAARRRQEAAVRARGGARGLPRVPGRR